MNKEDIQITENIINMYIETMNEAIYTRQYIKVCCEEIMLFCSFLENDIEQ